MSLAWCATVPGYFDCRQVVCGQFDKPRPISWTTVRELPLPARSGTRKRPGCRPYSEPPANGELDAGLDPAATATALVAVLQGGYVLARAAGSAEVYARAVDGALGLLACYLVTGDQPLIQPL